MISTATSTPYLHHDKVNGTSNSIENQMTSTGDGDQGKPDEIDATNDQTNGQVQRLRNLHETDLHETDSTIETPLLVFDGVSKLPAEVNGAVMVAGSNAAIHAAYFVAKAGARAAILHDCGIGRDEAGVSGLLWAEQCGMAMAAVASDTARVGDGMDMLQRGVISRANRLAASCGVEEGQTVRQAVELLEAAPWPHADMEAPPQERTFVHGVLCVDSISFTNAEDTGLVVASGSNGGIVAAGMTSSFRPRLALFNDAGFGVGRSGAASLPVLDADGIAAVTVAASSARIGDGKSTLLDGIVSAVNETAHRLGARVGVTALEVTRTVKTA